MWTQKPSRGNEGSRVGSFREPGLTVNVTKNAAKLAIKF